MNDQNEFFGEERLIELLSEQNHLPPKELITHIIEQVRLFTGHHNFQDDLSLVVMQVEKP